MRASFAIVQAEGPHAQGARRSLQHMEKRLTSYSYTTLGVGEHVFYRGDRYEFRGKGHNRVFLRNLETGLMHVALTSEIRAYTEGLSDAGKTLASDLQAHSKLVRSRLYTSVYYPPHERKHLPY